MHNHPSDDIFSTYSETCLQRKPKRPEYFPRKSDLYVYLAGAFSDQRILYIQNWEYAVAQLVEARC
jgi:hypothetical protein